MLIKNRHKILAMTIIFILIFSFIVTAEENSNQKINMNFKGADLRDVLRTIAELAAVNLVTDGSVQGSITIHLRDVTFREALDLITESQNLNYVWDNNTVVVATPERIDSIYAENKTITTGIKNSKIDNVKNIVTGTFPELNVQLDSVNNQLVLTGKEKIINKALNLIKEIDIPDSVDNEITKIVNVNYADPHKIKENLSSIYSNLTIQADQQNNDLLILKGLEKDINDALTLINRLDVKGDISTESVQIKYTDPQQIKTTITALYPDLIIQANLENKILFIKGKRENIDQALKIVERLDIEKTIITETVKVKYGELEKIRTSVAGVYPQLILQTDSNNNQLVIKGKEEDVKKALSLVENLDIKKDIYTETISVQYVDMEKIKQTINGLYPELVLQIISDDNLIIIKGGKKGVTEVLRLVEKMDKSAQTITSTVKIDYADITGLAESIAGIYPELIIQSDINNSYIILKGKKADIDNAKSLIKEMDIPKKIGTETVKLQYIDFHKIEEQIKDKYSNLEYDYDQANKELVITGKKETLNESIQFIKGLDVAREQDYKIVAVDYAEVNRVKEIINNFYPDFQIQINEQKRELILHGEKSKLADVLSLVDSVDTPRKQVLIEARIEEISSTGMSKFGIMADQLTQIKFLKDENNVINGLELTWPDLLQAMEKEGTARTLANPSLITLSGESAKLLIGDRIPVEVSENEDGEITTSIQWIDAGISFEFTPWITSDNRITLEVIPKVSSLGETIAGGLPSINTREAQTKIRLDDGQTFAIGGLIQDDVIESIAEVPILSDIPILGELFKHKTKDNLRTEVMIFITPNIIKEDSVNQKQETSIQKESEKENEKENENRVPEEIMIDIEDMENQEKKNYIENLKKENPAQDQNKELEENKKNTDEKEKEKETINKNTEEKVDKEKEGFQGLSEDELMDILKENHPEDYTDESDTKGQDKREKYVIVYEGYKDKDSEQKNELTDINNKKVNKPEKDQKQEKKDKISDYKITLNAKKKLIDNIYENDDFSMYYFYNYQTEKGDTIDKLSNRFGISKDDIKNAIKDEPIEAGIKIILPIPRANTYTVKKGDTLWQIHKKYNVSVDLLKKINNIDDETNIPIGEILVIPQN